MRDGEFNTLVLPATGGLSLAALTRTSTFPTDATAVAMSPPNVATRPRQRTYALAALPDNPSSLHLATGPESMTSDPT
jgi:hypothetical protein